MLSSFLFELKIRVMIFSSSTNFVIYPKKISMALENKNKINVEEKSQENPQNYIQILYYNRKSNI